MLVFDFRQIGNKMLEIRKKYGLTQHEIAAKAEISERTYAEIERGSTNMRIETLLRICEALKITPDNILTTNKPKLAIQQEELLRRLDNCSSKEKEIALNMLSIYIDSVE